MRHILREIRVIVNEALADMGPKFEAAYSNIGRPSIAPEKLLRAPLLQLFHGIRSERQMTERLDFDLSFRWFLGSASTIGGGCLDLFQRIASGCSTATVRRAFFQRPWPDCGGSVSCRASIFSRSMAR